MHVLKVSSCEAKQIKNTTKQKKIKAAGRHSAVFEGKSDDLYGAHHEDHPQHLTLVAIFFLCLG